VSSTNAELGNRLAAGGEFGAVHSIRNRCARQAEEIDADLDMTPMIDVVFQLLIFFMVASSIAVMGQLSLPPAVTGDTEDVRERVTLVLDLPPDMLESLPERGGATMFLSEAVLYFNDEPDRKLPGADLRQELRSKFAAHRAQRESSSMNSDKATTDNSNANTSTAGAVQLILMAHRRAPVRLVRQVLAMAREEGAGEALVGVATRMGAPTGGGSP
jgi:hypothetical protein